MVETARPSDAELIAAYRQCGEATVLEELYRRHVDASYRLACQFLNASDAEDAVQTAFLGVGQRLHQYQGRGTVRGWIMASVVNACRIRLREEARRRRREREVAMQFSDEAPESDAPDPELLQQLRDALAGLPDKVRLPVWLRIAEGLSFAEVAQALGRPDRTVRSQVDRGLDMLRSRLARVGVPLGLVTLTGHLGSLAAQTAPAHLAAQVGSWSLQAGSLAGLTGGAAGASSLGGAAGTGAGAGISAIAQTGIVLTAIAGVAGGSLLLNKDPQSAPTDARPPAPTPVQEQFSTALPAQDSQSWRADWSAPGEHIFRLDKGGFRLQSSLRIQFHGQGQVGKEQAHLVLRQVTPVNEFADVLQIDRPAAQASLLAVEADEPPAPQGKAQALRFSTKALQAAVTRGRQSFQLQQAGRRVGSVALEVQAVADGLWRVAQNLRIGLTHRHSWVEIRVDDQVNQIVAWRSELENLSTGMRRQWHGQRQGQFVQGSDVDGDGYRFAVSGDLIPTEALPALVLATELGESGHWDLQRFDSRVQDVLPSSRWQWRTVAAGMQILASEQEGYELVRQADGALHKLSVRQASGRQQVWQAAKDVDVASDMKELRELVAKAPVDGVLVTEVVADSQAEAAHMRTGDIVTKYGAHAVTNLRGLQKAIHAARQAKLTEVPLTLWRDGAEQQLTLKPGSIGIRPASVQAGKPIQSSRPAPRSRLPHIATRNDMAKLAKAKCGSQLRWYTDKDEAFAAAQAAGQQVIWWAPIAHGAPSYRTEIINTYLQCGWFTDPELVAQLQDCVLLRRPASAADLQGLGLTDIVGPMLIFCKPDGTLSHHLHGLTTQHRDLFRAVLAKTTPLNLPALQGDAGTLDLAAVQKRLGIGADAALLAALQAEAARSPEARTWLLLGRAAADLQNEAVAKQAFMAASTAAAGDPALATELAVAQVRWHLHRGDVAAADKIVGPFNYAAQRFPATAELQYLHGVVNWLQGQDKQARQQWAAVVQAQPDEPWAWRAAAEHGGLGPFARGFETLRYLDKDLIQQPPQSSDHPQPAPSLAHVVRDGLRFLLEHQATDGGWHDSNYEFGGLDSLPNVHMAVSALCTEALLRWRAVEPDAVDQALQRSFTFLTNPANLNPADADEIIWAHLYRVNCFAAWHQRSNGERKAALASQLQSLSDLLTSQHQNEQGLWRHEYYNGFVTGSVMLALAAARDQGTAVDQKAIRKACAALTKVRARRGSYPYFPKTGASPEAWKGGFGRAVNAEAALRAWGKGSDQLLQQSIGKYLYWHFVQDRVRKHSFHSDAYGTGGFFFWYNTHVLAQALEHSDQATAARSGRFLEEVVRETREIDGSFVDAFQLGKTYATAMALIVADISRQQDEPLPGSHVQQGKSGQDLAPTSSDDQGGE